MLSEKIDDFYATIGRQSFFTLFEIEAHRQIANSVLWMIYQKSTSKT